MFELVIEWCLVISDLVFRVRVLVGVLMYMIVLLILSSLR